ncbi:MAG TPA: LuxR C-terminal-related transcriptional regulator, partial [Herpetosiphonaceae bacterium]
MRDNPGMSENIPLSDRELEVLRLVAEGASNNEIAQRLIISPNTVKVHIRNIYGKLGVLSRTEATMAAIKRGLIAIPGAPPPAPAPEPAPTLSAAPPPAILSNTQHDPAPPVSPVATAAPPEPAADPADPILVFEPDPEPVANVAPPAADPLDATPPISVDMEPAKLTPVAREDQPTHVVVSRKLVIGIVGTLAVLAAAVLFLIFIVFEPGQGTPTPGPPVAETWAPLTSIPQPVADGAAAFIDQSIYVVGGVGPAGTSAETRRLNLASGVWEGLPAKPTPAADIDAAVIKGKLYAPGGVGRDGAPSATLEIFDLTAKTWSSGPALPAPRTGYGLAAFEGELFVIGGRDASGPVATTLIFDPDTQQWREGAGLPIPLQDAAVAARRDEIYLLGGTTAGGQPSLATFRYSLGQWQRAADLPAPRSHAAAVAVSDQIFLIGGSETSASILVFAGGAWSEAKINTGYPLSRHMLVSDERNIYALGGWNGTTSLADVRRWQPSFQVYIPGV